MWIGDQREIHLLAVPSIRPALGPVLQHHLAASSWSRLSAVQRELEAGGLSPEALFLAVRHELADGSGEFGGEAEEPFVDRLLPDDIRVEIDADTDPRELGTALADAIRAVPLRWRLDVLTGIEDVVWDLQDRRPRRERGDTVWRRYGRRHAGRRPKRR